LESNARDVVLDGLLRQVEAVGDLPVRQALGDEVEDTPFLIRKPVEAFVASGSVAKSVEDAPLSWTGR